MVGLPARSETARLLLDRLGPKAYAFLENVLDDPKVPVREKIAIAKMILDRWDPEPKVDSANAATRISIGVNPTGHLAAVLEKAEARKLLTMQQQPTSIDDDQDQDQT